MASIPPLVACVEASEPVASVLDALLTCEGYRVVTCTPPYPYSHAYISDFLREARPHVVLYDIAPPYASQWQSYQRVRAALPDCPFVLMTTNKRLVDVLAGPAATVDTVAKPFDFDDLLAAVQRGLARSVARAAPVERQRVLTSLLLV